MAPSSYSTGKNYELIETGEKSGEWGDITNQNLMKIDQSLTQNAEVYLSGYTATETEDFKNEYIPGSSWTKYTTWARNTEYEVDNIVLNRKIWAADTAYAVGEIIEDDSNSRIYKCIVDGTSGGTQPAGFSGGESGDEIADNDVTWTYWGDSGALVGDEANAYICTEEGYSEDADGAGPSGVGSGEITDGDAKWKFTYANYIFVWTIAETLDALAVGTQGRSPYVTFYPGSESTSRPLHGENVLVKVRGSTSSSYPPRMFTVDNQMISSSRSSLYFFSDSIQDVPSPNIQVGFEVKPEENIPVFSYIDATGNAGNYIYPLNPAPWFNSLTLRPRDIGEYRRGGPAMPTGDNTPSFVFDANSNSDFYGERSIAIGQNAGNPFDLRRKSLNVGAKDNVCIGHNSGSSFSTIVGIDAAAKKNVLVGSKSGANGILVEGNTFVGDESGQLNVSGDHNLYLGLMAGRGNTTQDKNILIGPNVGETTTGADSILIIDHEDKDEADQPTQSFVYGDMANDALSVNSASGISDVLTVNNICVPFTQDDCTLNDTDLTKVLLGDAAGVIHPGLGQSVSGSGVAAGSIVTSIAGSYVFLSLEHSGYATGVTLTFGPYAGDILKINATSTDGFDFISATANSVEKFKVDSAGMVTGDLTGSVTVGSGKALEVSGGGTIKLDGNFPEDEENVFMGSNAGASIAAEGCENTGIGDEAGRYITTGAGNTFVGHKAGTSHSSNKLTGDANVGLGAASLNNVTTGQYNTAIGSASGHALVGGSSNVMIGRHAGYGTNRSSNILIGPEVGTTDIGADSILVIDDGDQSSDQNEKYFIYGDMANGTFRMNATHDLTNDQFTISNRDIDVSGGGSILKLNSEGIGATTFNYIECGEAGGSELVFKVRGDGNVYNDNEVYSTPADYADMFEWSDGNPDAEDRIGLSVVLDGEGGIRIATGSDAAEDVVGIVSGTACMVGNAAWSKWDKTFLKDDFGRPTDQPNPDYDESLEYVPRGDRPEWAIIGLTGRVHLRKGSPAHPSWRKIRDVSAVTEEWLVR